ncbi:CAP domain-containing protein [Photobacterium sp. ZSDE20]|nr:CAP domain-containing protein [Photobacterium sp. ZSDE20]
MNKSHQLLISTILVILVAGCNSSSGKSNKSTSNITSGNNSSNTSTSGTSTSTSGTRAFKGNVFTLIEGFLEEANSSGISTFENTDKVSTLTDLPSFQGSDIPSTQITLTTTKYPTMSGFNNATVIEDDNGLWNCYKATNLTAERNNNKIIADGKIEKYKFDYNANMCTNILEFSYSFNNATIDEELKLEQPNTVFSQDQSGNNTPIQTYYFIAQEYGKQLIDNYGDSWLGVFSQNLISEATVSGNQLFKINSNGHITLSPTSSSHLIDFNSLNKQDILSGRLFSGAPGVGAASPNWCKIVNIPEGVSASAIQYQTVIATNCARSTVRYCDAHGSDPAGNYPAVAPVAWDDTSKNNAQLNSDEQYNKNKQGHFVMHSAGQNAFVLEAKSAIIPIIGYSTPRNDGKTNNAGAPSWAGHAGHCQNVMNASHTKVGVASRDAQPTKSGIQSYWTQDFN